MKKIVGGVVLTACLFAWAGWGSAYSDNTDRERGDKQAERDYQQNYEDIKRTQGDESGRRAIHEQGAQQSDERTRW